MKKDKKWLPYKCLVCTRPRRVKREVMAWQWPQTLGYNMCNVTGAATSVAIGSISATAAQILLCMCCSVFGGVLSPLCCLYCNFMLFLCTYDIYCTSVRPGRGIPSSVSLPEVSSIFSLFFGSFSLFVAKVYGERLLYVYIVIVM